MDAINTSVNWFRDKIYFKHLGVEAEWQEHHNAHSEVRTCEDASLMRGIKLQDELKSIILKINDNFYVFHYRGNERFSKAVIREYFSSTRNEKVSSNNFHFASKEELLRFDAEQGTVSPANKAIWEIYSFIAPNLVPASRVSTNDCTLKGWIMFNSKILISSPQNNIRDAQPFTFSFPYK